MVLITIVLFSDLKPSMDHTLVAPIMYDITTLTQRGNVTDILTGAPTHVTFSPGASIVKSLLRR